MTTETTFAMPTCESCGTPVLRRKNRWCSRRCWMEAKRRRVQQQCERCGKEFETHPSRLRRGHGRFCSRACWYASAGHARPERTCAYAECSATFPITPEQPNKRFCCPH